MSFKELFEKYGYSITDLGHNDYIAENDKFIVPFSEYEDVYTKDPRLAGVSIPIQDKEKLMDRMNVLKEKYPVFRCGFDMFNDIQNFKKFGITHSGLIANHDHSIYEIDGALREMQN